MVDTSIQALAVEDADLDLDHVEPTGVLGRVVEFQTAQDAAGFGAHAERDMDRLGAGYAPRRGSSPESR